MCLKWLPFARFCCRLVCHRPLALGRLKQNDSPAAHCTSALEIFSLIGATAPPRDRLNRTLHGSVLYQPPLLTSPLAAGRACSSPQ